MIQAVRWIAVGVALIGGRRGWVGRRRRVYAIERALERRVRLVHGDDGRAEEHGSDE